MPFVLKARVYQKSTKSYFRIVEQAIFYKNNGGTWGESDGALTLTVNGENSDGMLRFQTQDGKERFTVVLGVFQQKVWVHIIPDITSSETCVNLLPLYHDGGKYANIDLVPSYEVKNSSGRNLSVAVKEYDGWNYDLDIVIG
ncbi:hypothetical protein NUW58_g3061 [Xylaria curta]|uniref:Uncharacterized protein n=1 Tax=Xylaria curta TaxID=42375 RepID=A0ACC1PE12_9PEZI|nr:hypothetical protein NUW58_g3061 [Xylaria curta]